MKSTVALHQALGDPVACDPYATRRMPKHEPRRTAEQKPSDGVAVRLADNDQIAFIGFGELDQPFTKVIVDDDLCFDVRNGF